jgi:peptidoglycan/xylan/chitin deacetylase (PgdA/CDA1 family)
MNLSPLTKELLLTVYRWSTRQRRSELAREFRINGTYPATIFFYHRVANVGQNGWSISHENFKRHLDWIETNSKFASLDDIQKSQLNGHRTIPMVGITFDDGYGENNDFAIPHLVERKIPCTYFVSTHFIETGDPFAHDLAIGQSFRPNTKSEITQMAAKGITIGAHSHTHPDFGREMSDQKLRTEIHDVRKKLQDWSQQPVNYFAFPFGLAKNITQRAIDFVFDAGFECFLSAAGGHNWPGFDTNHLQRVHGDPGLASVANWLTLDPRKLRSKSPIIYHRESGDPQRSSLPQT